MRLDTDADSEGWTSLRAGAVALGLELAGLSALALATSVHGLGPLGLTAVGSGGLIGLLGLFSRGDTPMRRNLGRALCLGAIALVVILAAVVAAAADSL